MAVAGAESFLTVQALEVADDPGLRRHILKDLAEHSSFEARLGAWPRLLFGSSLDLAKGPGARLLFAKSRRNALLHGVADEVVADSSDEIRGLGGDPGLYPVSLDEAEDALDAALWLVDQILRRRGLSDRQIRNLSAAWTQ